MVSVTFVGKPCRKCGGLERYLSNRKCIPCSAATVSKWRVKNHEKIKAYNTKWRLENPEKCKAYDAKWRTNNPEMVIFSRRGSYVKRTGRKHEHSLRAAITLMFRHLEENGDIM